MTAQEANFRLWWQQHYATRALFVHNEEMAKFVFNEVWKIAIEEAASVAEEVNPFVATKVRTLCT